MEMISKSFSFKDTSLDNTSKKISGYASTFSNLDLNNDVMIQGCFKKHLKNKAIPILYGHEKTNQIGWSTLMKEDKNGLYVEGELIGEEQDLQKTKEAIVFIKSAIDKGFSMGISIGGIPLEYELVKSKKSGYHYEITDFKVIEYSITSVPANQLARITSMKSFVKEKNLEEKEKEKGSENLHYKEISELYKKLYLDLLIKTTGDCNGQIKTT